MSIETSGGESTVGVIRRLAGTRLVTRIAITAERLWPLVLPILIVASLFLAAAWSGLFRVMPDIARFALVVLFGLAALAALLPLRSFRAPSRTEIDRRIEGANRLEHTPVQVLTDRPGGKPDLFAEALWREHQQRMATKLGSLSSDLPRSRVPERDPWGLRAVAPLLLLAALAFSYGPFGGRVMDAFSASPGEPALPARIDAWVTPPAYTGKPPIFLTAENNNTATTFTVPEGSEIALRVAGGDGVEQLGFVNAAGLTRQIEPQATEKAEEPVRPQIGAPLQFAGTLTENGTLSLKSGDTELRQWAFTVIPDTPPSVRFVDEPKRTANGSLELRYEINDDYGAATGQAEIKLADLPQPGARPLYATPELPLTLPRRNAAPPVGKTSRDLSDHVWAGARVSLTLKVVDAANQEARSETKTLTLQERTFTNPLAKALVEQRRILGLDANRKDWVLTLIDAITLRPEDTFESMTQFLALMSAKSRLEMAQSDDELRGVADYFWEIALGIEDGELSTAEKRLRAAQEKLKQALERGASDEEIDKLMRELRQAMNDFLREFAEKAMKDRKFADESEAGKEITRNDLDRMLKQLEEMAKSGDRDAAQELLSQLEDMMNNLQALNKPGQQGQQGMAGEMRKQMDKLGEIMRRQQQMMNETFRTERQQRGQQGQEGQEGEPQDQLGQEGEPRQGRRGERGRQGQQGEQGQPGDGENGRPMSPQEFADAMKQLQEQQQKLQDELNGLSDSLRNLGIDPGEGFGDAGDEMGNAGKALGDQQGERATGHQGKALEALRRGGQEMMQQMQQAMEGDEGGSEQGGRQKRADRDPLGRPRATEGFDDDSTVEVPEVIDAQRARRILEAIRKRLGNALSPELERQYLERLLEMR